MKKIVLVSQAFPPVAGSHATRVLALVKHLRGKFEVRGIGIEIGDKYPQRDDNLSIDIEVLRTFPGIAHRYAHGSSDGGRHIHLKGVKLSGVKRIKSKIAGMLRDLYRKIEVFDSYFDWIPFLAYSLRKSIKDQEIIISTSMPNSVHVATLIALVGKRNKWIADFGDPWTLDHSRPTYGSRRVIEKAVERLIVSRATGLSFTTQATLDDYSVIYPHHRDKMFVVRMGFSLDDDSILVDSVRDRTVFYGGSLPHENRNAAEFLAVIDKFREVEFIFAGNCVKTIRNYYNEDVPRNIVLIPWLSHEEFIKYLKGSEISVVFGNSNYQQVPGKIYQMARFSNKILYISGRRAGEKDESFEIIGDIAKWSFNDRLSISNQLEALLSEEAIDRSLNHKSYSWASNISLLEDYIQKLGVERA